MRTRRLFVLLPLLAACGDDPAATGDTSPNDTNDTRDTRDVPAPDGDGDALEEVGDVGPDTLTGDYATLVFTLDDSANKTYTAADGLAWKGSFSFDAASGIMDFDASWGGPFVTLRDDGQAGDVTAGDGIWTGAAKIASPTADLSFEYGAIRDSVDGSDGLWIWKGTNGTFSVPAGSTDTINVPGLVIPAFGTIDLKLTLDVSGQAENLHPLFQGVSYTDVKVKGGVWSWREIAMRDDGQGGDAVAGDEVYTFVYGDNLGKHDGLLAEGEEAPFVFVLNGTEYKADSGPPTDGVTAAIDSGTGFVQVPVQTYPDGDRNTYVVATAARPPFEPPAGHVAINFTVDDALNQTYEDGDGLAWKGSFVHDPDTRTISHSSSWAGPFALLYDDGPWDRGGHEPAGSVAGDHRWGVTVWAPNTATQTFDYGAIRGSVDGSDGPWIWSGPNGSFTVNAGSSAPVTATGLTIAAHGNVDLRLTIDVSNRGANLVTLFQGGDYTNAVEVKGSAWAWTELALVDDGTSGDQVATDGVYTFTLSAMKDKHDGLMKTGDLAEFVFVLGGTDYRDGSAATTQAISAWTKKPGADWVPATIGVSGQNNTYVTAP